MTTSFYQGDRIELRGPQGEPGPEGPQGPIGPVGPAGKDGIDGRDGKDGNGAGISPSALMNVPYTISGFVMGQPEPGEVLLYHVFSRETSFGDLSGCQARAAVPPVSDYPLEIYWITRTVADSGRLDVLVATIIVQPDGFSRVVRNPDFPTEWNFGPNRWIKMKAPSEPDPQIQDIAYAIPGTVRAFAGQVIPSLNPASQVVIS